jgi:hypothetical protein
MTADGMRNRESGNGKKGVVNVKVLEARPAGDYRPELLLPDFGALEGPDDVLLR